MNRLLLILTLSLTLAGCGFQALHGKQYREKLAVDLSSLSVDVDGTSSSSSSYSTASMTIPRRYGELLKAEIQDQVNPTGQRSEKLFNVAISFTESDNALFVNPDGTASRGNLVYYSTYAITRRADMKVVASGNITRTSSYNTSPTADYASYVSIEDARKRAMMELAEDYKLRLAALLPTLNNPNASAVAPKPSEDLPAIMPVRNYEAIRKGY